VTDKYSSESVENIVVSALSDAGFMPDVTRHSIELVLDGFIPRAGGASGKEKANPVSRSILYKLLRIGLRNDDREIQWGPNGFRISESGVIKMLEWGVEPIAHREILEAFKKAGVEIKLPPKSHAKGVAG